MIEAAGHIPTSPPVIAVGPVLLTTGVAPRIPNPQADPCPGGGTGTHTADVVNFHTKLAANLLPKRSVAPVVIVAVKTVVAERAAEGVNAAVVPA